MSDKSKYVVVVTAHSVDCPLVKQTESKKPSSGAVSNAYRTGWDVTFGGNKPIVGQS